MESLNATVSHEMMTPINFIVAFADQILGSTKDESIQKFAGVISKTSKLLKLNLKDLLDRNLMENGALEPVYQRHKLSAAIEEVVEIMQY
jgi:signal transduction histidine kinase